MFCIINVIFKLQFTKNNVIVFYSFIEVFLYNNNNVKNELMT